MSGSINPTATTNATQITYATGGFDAAIERGDLVYNADQTASGYVETVDSDTQLTLVAPGIAGQTDADTAIWFNVLPIAMDTLDDVYVSIFDEYPTGTTVSESIVFDAQLFYRVKVSNTRNATKIKRFVSDTNTNGSDNDTPVVRTTDTIHS